MAVGRPLVLAVALAAAIFPAVGAAPTIDVVVHGVDGRLLEPGAYPGELPAFEQRYVADGPALEPPLAIAKDGTAFFVSWGTPSPVGETLLNSKTFRSSDQGETWQDVTPRLPSAYDSDPILMIDPRTDRLYNLTYFGGCITLHWSDDNGATWTTNPRICDLPGIITDHPTLFSGPPRPGMLTAYPSVLYLCINGVDGAHPSSGAGYTLASRCLRSIDGGLSFLPAGSPFRSRCEYLEGLHGHGMASPDGILYLPAGKCGGKALLAISRDGGTTWDEKLVDDTAGFTPDGLDEHDGHVALDEAGNLYFVWLDARALPRLSVSRDGGATWSRPMSVGVPGVTYAKLAGVVAGAEGRIAISYIGTTVAGGLDATQDDLSRANWNAYASISLNALDADPIFATVSINDPADPLHRGSCARRCLATGGGPYGMYDYRVSALSPATGQVWTTLSDNCTGRCAAPDGTSSSPTANRGAVGVQISGTRLS